MRKVTILILLGSALNAQIIVMRRAVSAGTAAVCPAGYLYGSPIPLPTPASTLTNMQIAIAGTLADLGIGGSGKVQHSDTLSRPYAYSVPADLVFTDTNGSTLLPNFDVDEYDSSTGRYIIHLLYPSLTTGGGTIHACYDKSSVTTYQGNVNGTWPSGFKLVAHFQDGSTLNQTDSTSNNNDGSNGGFGSDPAAATGPLGGAANYLATNRITQWSVSATKNQAQVTYSAWINANSFSVDYGVVYYESTVGGSFRWAMGVRSSGKPYCGGRPGNDAGAFQEWRSNTALSTGTLYHFVCTIDLGSSAFHMYINGSEPTLEATGTFLGSAFPNTDPDFIFSGADSGNGSNFDGKIDELRTFQGILSPDAVSFIYANQNSPATLGAATLN